MCGIFGVFLSAFIGSELYLYLVFSNVKIVGNIHIGCGKVIVILSHRLSVYKHFSSVIRLVYTENYSLPIGYFVFKVY